jgi:hypothetical protein
MGDPPTIQIRSALLDEYRAALDGLKGLTDTNPGYRTILGLGLGSLKRAGSAR